MPTSPWPTSTSTTPSWPAPWPTTRRWPRSGAAPSSTGSGGPSAEVHPDRVAAPTMDERPDLSVDRADVERWVAGYERAWRSPGTDALAEVFTPDVTYLVSPWAEPLVGLDRLGPWWEGARDGPDEAFTMRSEVVAVEGDTAVVRVAV